jgi:NADPH:quinone reductase-like Zn-dependent oxidoreductase
MSLPKHTAAWTIDGQGGIEALKLVKELPIPSIKDDEVLVRIHAASLSS